jgi:hypothetical protein
VRTHEPTIPAFSEPCPSHVTYLSHMSERVLQLSQPTHIHPALFEVRRCLTSRYSSGIRRGVSRSGAHSSFRGVMSSQRIYHGDMAYRGFQYNSIAKCSSMKGEVHDDLLSCRTPLSAALLPFKAIAGLGCCPIVDSPSQNRD